MSGVTDTIAAARLLSEGGSPPTARQVADALDASMSPESHVQGSEQ